jgi:hypothetical protein
MAFLTIIEGKPRTARGKTKIFREGIGTRNLIELEDRLLMVCTYEKND